MISFSPLATINNNSVAYLDYYLIASVGMLGILALSMNVKFMIGLVYGQTEIDKAKRNKAKTDDEFDEEFDKD